MTREKIRKDAEKLRSEGKSYGDISSELGVAKSTLSYWFSTTSNYLATSEKQRNHLERARILSKESLKRRSHERDIAVSKKIVKSVFSGIEKIDIFTKKVALSMLYWAEGTKHKKASGVTFTNTDPALIKTFVSLLGQTFKIDRAKIKVRLHIHDYHNENECKKFWTSLLNIEMDQFNKTHIKQRSISKKFRENYMGICFVYYPNSDIRREILEIGRQFFQKI